MANESNFLIFNTDNSSAYTYSDSEYSSESQRASGVQTGQAKSRLHNKMFRQWSVMAYMLGQLIANSGHDAEDSDPDGLLAGFKAAIAGNSNISNTVWEKSTAVSVGTVVKSPNMPTWAYAECTTAGTTSTTEPSWGAVADATITDNTAVWTLRSYLPFTGATASAAGTSGIVPAPAIGDQNKVLTGGAAFKDILSLLTAFTGATASAAGALGGVPAPAAGQQLNVLTGAGSFQTLATLLADYGVQYNIAQNGYVKFGDLFGGLILQWGSATATNASNLTYFPIPFPTGMLSAAYIPLDDNNSVVYRVSYTDLTLSSLGLVTTSSADIFVRYIVLGY